MNGYLFSYLYYTSLPDRAHRGYQNHLFGPQFALASDPVAMFQIDEVTQITIDSVRSPLPKRGDAGYENGGRPELKNPCPEDVALICPWKRVIP